jgi:hypothetical protein
MDGGAGKSADPEPDVRAPDDWQLDDLRSAGQERWAALCKPDAARFAERSFADQLADVAVQPAAFAQAATARRIEWHWAVPVTKAAQPGEREALKHWPVEQPAAWLQEEQLLLEQSAE